MKKRTAGIAMLRGRGGKEGRMIGGEAGYLFRVVTAEVMGEVAGDVKWSARGKYIIRAERG